jgi:hypothetical protein
MSFHRFWSDPGNHQLVDEELSAIFFCNRGPLSEDSARLLTLFSIDVREMAEQSIMTYLNAMS